MEAALSDLEPLVLAFPFHPIDEPISAGNPARPPAFEISLQRLRLAGARERASPALLDQCVQSLERLRIGRAPMVIILPSKIVP